MWGTVVGVGTATEGRGAGDVAGAWIKVHCGNRKTVIRNRSLTIFVISSSSLANPRPNEGFGVGMDAS
jgi:hypothetical protein